MDWKRDSISGELEMKRKVAVLVGDGMGDDPGALADGRTPLQAARIPWMRKAAALGNVRLVQTVPGGMAPGSDVANMGLLGYDARENYTGRAAIEAAGAGVALQPGEVAYRTNLVTVEGGRMIDYSAGDISTEEGRELIAALGVACRVEGLRFHGGVSYRHLAVWKGGPDALDYMPPHEIANREVAGYLPKGARAEEWLAVMELSREVFAGHPVNEARRAAGKRAATQIWPWGAGRAMSMERYGERYGLKGGIISAVDLIRGLGTLCGLEVIRVPGATGWIDTDYAGKAAAAIDCLGRSDFAYVHVEAPDECGHKGMPEAKVAAMEAIDREIVGPVWRALEAAGEPYRLLVCTDHRTPVAKRGHTGDPVPFAWVDGPVGAAALEGDAAAEFDEFLPRPADGELPLVCRLVDGLLKGR